MSPRVVDRADSAPREKDGSGDTALNEERSRNRNIRIGVSPRVVDRADCAPGENDGKECKQQAAIREVQCI